MLKIRLQRVGRIHEPSFRLVLTDSKNSTKSGKFIEILGNYDSRRGEKSEFKSDRVTYWMSKGAQVSPTVHNLLVSTKVITDKKINNLPLKKPIAKDEGSAPASEAVASKEEAKVEEAEELKEEVVEEVKEEVAPTEESTAEVAS